MKVDLELYCSFITSAPFLYKIISPNTSTKKVPLVRRLLQAVTHCHTAAPNLITVLLHKGGGFSVKIVHTITALRTFNKMSLLVSISKEAYEVKLILFKAPDGVGGWS